MIVTQNNTINTKVSEYNIARQMLTTDQLQEVERIKGETSDWGGFGRVEDLEIQKDAWKNIELDLMKGLMTEEQLQRLKEKSR